MGSYCKAYPIERFAEFPEWTGQTAASHANEGSHEKYLFLQENYVVTGGIFMDEKIVFSNVTSAWKTFCAETLKFEVPKFDGFRAGAAVA